MKINIIIKNKRKEKNLTQEELANLLGVSTPAVSKWESGISYPDITILPPLARVLDTDLNTLLSFKEDLTREEIGAIMNKVSETMYGENFEAGYKFAMDKIKEFPNSYQLIYNIAILLEGSLFLFKIENMDEYQGEIFRLYNRGLESDDEEIRYAVVERLAGKYIEEDNFEEAEKLLDSLPDISYNKNLFKGSLYFKKKEYNKSYEIYESELLYYSNKLITVLLSLMEIAVVTEDIDNAKNYADIIGKTSKLYELWGYNTYVGDFQLAVSLKNEKKIIENLRLLFESMEEPWVLSETRLYSHMKAKKNDESIENPFEQLKSIIINSLTEDKDLEFLKENDEFNKLLEAYTR